MREKPFNRQQFYNEIAIEVQKHSLAEIKKYMKVTFKTEKYDRLDLHELEQLLNYLRNLS